MKPAIAGASKRRLLAALVGVALSASAAANSTFTIEPDAPDVVGELGLTTAVYEDTISDLAKSFDQGFREMRLANPKVDAWLPGAGTEVLVPSQYVIPEGPRDGIIVNVPEMRLYYFPPPQGKGPAKVMTFPISIGREQWVTPHGMTTVVGKVKDPVWYPPESIRKEHAQEGDPLPKIVPAGPNNPLGTHALRLGLNGYLIHGTDKPFGIGMRVTHGCIRMYPADIVTMFNVTPVGTRVHLVNEPYKVGLAHGNIYLEVHPPLEEEQAKNADAQYSLVVQSILDRVKAYDAELIWPSVKRAVEEQSGVPQVVGTVRKKTTTANVQTAPAAATLPKVARNGD